MTGHEWVRKAHRCLLCVLLIGNAFPVSAQESIFRHVSISTIKARPLGMGGAFVSIEDDLAALDFNPAAFMLHSSLRANRFAVFMNPLGPALIAANWNQHAPWETLLGWIVRGAAISIDRFRFGFLLGEEVLSNTDHLERSGFLDASGILEQKNSSVGISVALASRVSLGVAAELFQRLSEGKRIVRMGYRYGILFKARHSLNIGLCFIDFPNHYQEDRMPLERLADETLNIGISYVPVKQLALSLDFRNVSDDGKGAVREPHVGVEVTPWKHVTLRGGFFSQIGENSETYSVGFGLFNWNTLFSEERGFSHPLFCVNAAFLWQQNKGLDYRYFVMTLLARL